MRDSTDATEYVLCCAVRCGAVRRSFHPSPALGVLIRCQHVHLQYRSNAVPCLVFAVFRTSCYDTIYGINEYEDGEVDVRVQSFKGCTYGHSTQHAARSTPRTVYSTQHTARSTQHAAHSTPHKAHSIKHIDLRCNCILHFATNAGTAKFLKSSGTTKEVLQKLRTRVEL